MLLQVRDNCSDCGHLTLIQNKKLWLCGECIFKKNHGGKSKEEVYRERAEKRSNQVRNTQHRDLEQTRSKFGDKIKKASKLSSISSEKKYRCSDGSLVSQADIKWRLSITYDKIKQTRLAVCQGSGRSDVPLSFSHTISQARCKELSKTELIWDEDNIELEGFEAPTSNPQMAHNTWECGSIDKKIQLLNFDRKLEYIRVYDQETYNKYVIAIDELANKLQVESE